MTKALLEAQEAQKDHILTSSLIIPKVFDKIKHDVKLKVKHGEIVTMLEIIKLKVINCDSAGIQTAQD